MTAAHVLVETLLDWGVEVIFGLPGDGINGIMESLRTHKEKIRLSVALRAPVAFGVNVATIEQLAPGAKVDGAIGQVVVSAKSPALAPVIAGFLMLIGAPLGLPMVTVRGLLLTPTFCLPKSSALGKIPMTGRLSSRESELE